MDIRKGHAMLSLEKERFDITWTQRSRAAVRIARSAHSRLQAACNAMAAAAVLHSARAGHMTKGRLKD